MSKSARKVDSDSDVDIIPPPSRVVQSAPGFGPVIGRSFAELAESSRKFGERLEKMYTREDMHRFIRAWIALPPPADNRTDD